KPVDPRHLDVEKRDIGSRRDRGVHDLIATADIGDDSDVALQSEQSFQGAADHGLILREQDADCRRHNGTDTNTRKPPSGNGPAAARPPRAAARSWRPRRPFPRAVAPPSRPLSVISRLASRDSRVSRIEHAAAPLCRITFVTPSRTAHANVASTTVGRESAVTSIVLSMPAAASASRAPASAVIKLGCRYPSTA